MRSKLKQLCKLSVMIVRMHFSIVHCVITADIITIVNALEVTLRCYASTTDGWMQLLFNYVTV